MRFTIRNYRPDDFRTLWKIDQLCFAPGIAYTRFELESFIRRAQAFTLVAETQDNIQAASQEPQAQDGQCATILGFLVAERVRTAAGHVITIDVRDEARRARVGSTLLEEAEDRLRLWNCKVIRLETPVDNIAAISFYKRHGYDVVKVVPRYYSNGLDALLLEKNLLPPPPAR